MSPVVWLASYPKSGNTWLRLLIANLRQESPVDINDVPGKGGIASARFWFDDTMLFPSGLLSYEECDRLRPDLYRAIAADILPDDPEEKEERRLDGLRFMKSHDAYSLTDGRPLLGGIGAARAAILIVRDPRDVASSLAHHNGQTTDEAIAFMGWPHASYAARTDRQSNQLRQCLTTWAGFNAGWLDQDDIPLLCIRYEDLRADTAGQLLTAMHFVGIDASHAECEQAARFADFEELKRQESERGFREAPHRNRTAGFFRRGLAGGWRDELSPAQVARIEADQAGMMARLGYRCATEDERMTG